MTKEDKYNKYNNLFMGIAKLSSEMSHCKRAKVGCTIVRDNRVLVNSWNGTISGADNCCEEFDEEYTEEKSTLAPKGITEGESKNLMNKQGKLFIKLENNILFYKEKKLKTKNTVMHAEANALTFASKNGIITNGCTVYVTLSPCIECSKLMFQAGIKKVYYSEEYRITDGIDFLKEHGMEVIKLEN